MILEGLNGGDILSHQLKLQPISKLSENFADIRSRQIVKNVSCLKADFQSVLRTLESLFTTFVLFHVRRHKI